MKMNGSITLFAFGFSLHANALPSGAQIEAGRDRALSITEAAIERLETLKPGDSALKKNEIKKFKRRIKRILKKVAKAPILMPEVGPEGIKDFFFIYKF